MSDFQTSRGIKALRKTRQCYWCHDLLPVGCTARKVVGVWDGVFSALYMHPECKTAWANDPCTLEDGEACPYAHIRGKTCGENDLASYPGERTQGNETIQHDKSDTGADAQQGFPRVARRFFDDFYE